MRYHRLSRRPYTDTLCIGFLIPGLLIGYIYVSLSIPYLNTGRDLQRMSSTARSPIFSGFGETLEGIATIRAFGAELRMLNELHDKIDRYTQMNYNFWSKWGLSTRWHNV